MKQFLMFTQKFHPMVLLFVFLILPLDTAFAQSPPKRITLPPIGITDSPFNPNTPGGSFGIIISSIFRIVLIGAGLWAFFQLLMAGFSWISSGGDKQALEAARGKLTWALIGILIVAVSWGLIVLMEQMLGFCFGLSCPVNINALAP